MTASKRWLRWDRTSISPSPSALADVSHRQTATAAIFETMRFIVLQAPLDSRQPPSEISCCGLIYAYKPFYTRSFIESATVRYKRSEEHTSELQSLMRISYAVFCLQKTNKNNNHIQYTLCILTTKTKNYMTN